MSTDGTNLNDEALRTQLSGTRWHTIEVVESTGSTNADLIERSAGENVAGTVRLTTDQTAGRGRHTRVWAAPAGTQVAMSAAVDAGTNTEDLGWLSLIAGLAVADAVESVTAVRPTLKWPNDVLIDDRKVSGILSEYSRTSTGGIAVIGVGVNTTMTEDQLPVPTATSLAIVTGKDVSVTDLAAAYLRRLAELLDRWPAELGSLAEAYRERSDTIGRRVRVVLPGDKEVVGTATGIDSAGRIVVDANGQDVIVAAADVTHLRADG
ncbi:biotin--[acetyl-CoA-carboxylase] ligase [Gordonia sp. CPCC 205515]|uniref:biotin--[acetyl-CoA-carboxylase] ligase n=1 Tax=Gordonia sp. CPCC 205515 TaxID=3140791 RepID=UPI003AF38811